VSGAPGFVVFGDPAGGAVVAGQGVEAPGVPMVLPEGGVVWLGLVVLGVWLVVPGACVVVP
jgi:hypothetical protein